MTTRANKHALTTIVGGLFWLLIMPASLVAQFTDSQADRDALPHVPAGFGVALFAREPLVRQPCSMAFDMRGRLFVGMGPQYRAPRPDTPGDSVVIVLDTDGDGVAETTKVFATGFNAVQGLAWRGADLWVANAPDLTVVRDLDGDDQADQYVRVCTDLGNLEHGLHGSHWAADGKLYMSKGNSKGLTQPGRIAPKPFRDLWGATAHWSTEPRLPTAPVSGPLFEGSGTGLVYYDSPQLVRRGSVVAGELIAALGGGRLNEAQETWTAWTLGRIAVDDRQIESFFVGNLADDSPAGLNLRIQSVRILAHRIREPGRSRSLPAAVVSQLNSDQPRLRFAAVQSLMQAGDAPRVPELMDLLAEESDRTVLYASWQALRRFGSEDGLRAMLSDPRSGIRRAVDCQ